MEADTKRMAAQAGAKTLMGVIGCIPEKFPPATPITGAKWLPLTAIVIQRV
jgi:hypothetical protein